MQNLAHPAQKTQNFSAGAGSSVLLDTQWEADFHRSWRRSKVIWDVAQRVLRLAEVPTRPARALLALLAILRPGERRPIPLATLGARLDKDTSTASRHIDALIEWQTSSGYTFVEVDRCHAGEKIAATYTDRWDVLLIEAVRAAIAGGAPVDLWLKREDRGEEPQPAELAREAVAVRIFEQLHWQKPPAKPENPMLDENQLRDATRRRAEQFNPRLVKLLGDVLEVAEVDPFIAQVEFDKITKTFAKMKSEIDRRLQDMRFRQTFPDTENDGESDPDICKMQMLGIENKGVKVDHLQNANAEPPPDPSEDWSPEADPDNNFWEPPTDRERLEAALNYASLGRRILPVWGVTEDGACRCWQGAQCHYPGKHPALEKEWQLRATSDRAQVKEWWRQWPHANIGWLMDGHICFDFDGEAGLNQLQDLEQKGLIIPTLTAKTGSGGRHLIFSTDATEFKNAVKVVAGLDLRTHQRGMIVVAPSVSNKGAYLWMEGPSEPSALPVPLLEWLQNNLSPPDIEKETTQRAPAGNGYGRLPFSRIPEGERDQTLYLYLCGRRNSIADMSLIREIAYQMNSLCDPPMKQTQVEKIIRQVAKHQPATV